MKFSILIPVYNSEKYLDECVRSVLGQTHRDFEIVLIDDGSTDRSGEICDRYAEEYPDKVKVIHRVNSGQLISRVNAAANASGEYCIFADADDLIVPKTLEVLNRNITEYDCPDMLVYSFYYEESGKRRPSRMITESKILFCGENKQEFYKLFFTTTELNNVWTKAVKRSVLNSLTLDPEKYGDLRCAEDRIYSMFIADRCERIVYSYDLLYVYRIFGGSVTRNYDMSSIKRFNTALLYYPEIGFLEKWGFDLPEWRQRLDACYVSYILYTLDLFYFNVSKSRRMNVLTYDWKSFLPSDVIIDVCNNPFLNEEKKILWSNLEGRRFIRLRLYFLKKRILNNLKKVRRTGNEK